MTAGMMTACAYAQDLTFLKTINLNSKTDQMRVIAITILSESRGEGDGGIRRCGQVILNRARKRHSEAFRECLRPLQFSFWNHAPSRARCLKLMQSPQADLALYLAADIMAGKDVLCGFEATHFHSGASPAWAAAAPSMVFVEQYRGHRFYREL